jgi:hypothetical protein
MRNQYRNNGTGFYASLGIYIRFYMVEVDNWFEK